jgi:hypothetical protein
MRRRNTTREKSYSQSMSREEMMDKSKFRRATDSKAIDGTSEADLLNRFLRLEERR